MTKNGTTIPPFNSLGAVCYCDDGRAGGMRKRAARDPRTSRSFEGVKLEGVKESVAAQLCEASGGPCKYQGETMTRVHQGLDINSDEFNAFVQQLVATLDQFKVGAREKDDLLKLLAPMRTQIVTK